MSLFGMSIGYRTAATGGGGYAMLADDGDTTGLGDRISGFATGLSKTPQEDPLAFAAAPFLKDRGNATFSLRFKVERQHASAAAALTFQATHPALFNAKVNFDLMITVGAATVYLANCVCVRVEPEPHSDQSTRFSYEFVGGTYSSTAP